MMLWLAGAPPAQALGVTAGPLVGVFSVTSGSCSLAGPPSGSYLELLEHGVPVPNVSSPCAAAGSFYTPLRSGAVGLLSGAYQLDPEPTFDSGGNSVANQVVDPVKFLGIGFGLATTCADQQHAATPTGSCPQSGPVFPVPQLSAEPIGTGGCQPSLTNLTGALDECLYGNLEALGATYNGTASGTCASAAANSNGCYDLGAATGPSLSVTSCGSAPVGNCSLSGSFDPVNSTYTLDLASTIVGTPFNGAEAKFHLVGTFTSGLPSAGSGGSSGSGGGGAGGGGSGGTGSGGSSGSSSGSPSPSASGNAMVGQFAISAGDCGSGSVPQGSWVQLGLGGSPIKNSDSSCDGGAYTLVSQGSDGLVTGRFQPNPTPTFDSNGNSLAALIIAPAKFLGTNFGAATNPQNEQTAPSGPAAFPVPQAVLNGTRIDANLSAINFTYNGPPNGTCASGGGDGCYALGSTDVQGTYDPGTKAYTLQWTGTIHGGAFNNATATFHFEGVFSGTISATSTQLSQSGSLPSGPGSASATAASSGSSAAPAAGSAQPQANEMVGTFTIAAGECSSGVPGGSWIQLSKGGAPISNPMSTCDQGDYTTISQGSQGLVMGRFQPDPVPTFDGNGNSLAAAIIKPTAFLGDDFGAATDPQDMQHAPAGADVYPAPYAVLDSSGTSFRANLAALNFTYNGPPNGTCASGQGVGCYAVGSSNVQGTYNPQTRAYAMQWSGLVVGGAFNGATATFHFSGTFKGTITTVAASSVPTAGTAPGAASPAGGAAPSAFRVPTFQLAGARHLPGSGPLTAAEEVVTALLAVAAIGFGLSSSRRRPPAAGAP